jgi:hypothetical protein
MNVPSSLHVKVLTAPRSMRHSTSLRDGITSRRVNNRWGKFPEVVGLLKEGLEFGLELGVRLAEYIVVVSVVYDCFVDLKFIGGIPATSHELRIRGQII